ncbi:tRNA (adenine-N(1)-)-methyltransferase catalytic subunit trm61 [Emydomyces testavorans]|uniref:tRNA (adenine(58)-N(1))-methyltransferase catalytic subunit TRM61 n=1 Tax=Emydomyces testavorans TaxID=2070801 RepID=A0AAF0DD12_9EURO|nr:tRNA (adenine-N(1)-)-methyltransferase catalytic subunit trm61 [Emydomyces testavorans]
MVSPFFTTDSTAEEGSLAILHLRRNLQIPTILSARDEEDQGYKEGKVTNTRYGSFPHSTLINKPWGSQIIASKVDTGSRGRRLKERKARQSLKRKADEVEGTEANEELEAPGEIATTSGFIHLLRPTPESWTSSLPHRTQVVYTADYSYILHRLRVCPGSSIIEAGAGSGSFTHAAARAVFNGYPSDGHDSKRRRLGQVSSFEFHETRVQKVREEIRAHGLEGIVRVNHRDVYNDSFLLGPPWDGESPKANAIFLDLPAPWLALKHLVRAPPDGSESPLDPSSPIHICTFSPCLEQVQQTISALRQQSWLSISMVEVLHRNIEVRREIHGVECDGGIRGSIPGPRNVEEALSKLRSEEQTKALRELLRENEIESANQIKGDKTTTSVDVATTPQTKSATPASNILPAQADHQKPSTTVPTFKQGKVIHRSEPELKTHTSYLVFATLPCAWSEEDERRCREKWPSAKCDTVNVTGKKSKKQMKREANLAETENVNTQNGTQGIATEEKQ